MKNSLALTIFFLSALLLSNRCSSPGDKYDIKFVLQIDEADIIRDLAANSRDTTFLKAIALARQKQINSQKAFVELFGEVFSEIDPDARLASIFATRDRRHLIDFNSTNDEVIKVITRNKTKTFFFGFIVFPPMNMTFTNNQRLRYVYLTDISRLRKKT